MTLVVGVDSFESPYHKEKYNALIVIIMNIICNIAQQSYK